MKDCFKKVDFEKNQQTTKKYENFPVSKESRDLIGNFLLVKILFFLFCLNFLPQFSLKFASTREKNHGYHMDLNARKPFSGVCEEQRCTPAWA